MVFSNLRFRLGVVIRVILLFLSICVGCVLYSKSGYPVSMSVCAVIAVLVVFNLIYHVERTRRELAHFLNNIKYNDFMDAYPSTVNLQLQSDPSSKSVQSEELRTAFTRIIRDFQDIRFQREEQFHYVQTILQHIPIGILTYDQSGKVESVNAALKRMFQVNRLDDIADLERISNTLVQELRRIKPGRRQIVTVEANGYKQQLVILTTEFRRGDRGFKLASIQDLHSELEEREMEAWQNLMRVLTHEIRNSITPIVSLASTASEMVSKCDEEIPGEEEIRDVQIAVDTIQKRSQGLLKFIESFRRLYQVPKPTFEIVSTRELFSHLQVFFRPRFEENHIIGSFKVEPPSLELTVDPQLFEQVLINLVLNSIYAVSGVQKPLIEVNAGLDERGRTFVKVSDNGKGMQPEVLKRAFIPFFTTRHDGSGIGLSLCRQIMRLHGGGIQIHSEPGIGTVITLWL